MKLYSSVFLILLVLEEYYCAPFLDWPGERGGLVTDCGFGRRNGHGHHDQLLRPWDNFPKYSQYPQYPISQSDVEKMYRIQYDHGIPPLQRTPEGSPTSMPQYGKLYGNGLTDSCWYDDGTPYKLDDNPYYPSVATYNTYGPLYNPYYTPYNQYRTNYFGTRYPYGSPYNSYVTTHGFYTLSGQFIHCSPYGGPASVLGYPLRNSWGMPVPDISTKPLQKPIDIPDDNEDLVVEPYVEPRKYLDKPSTNSAESSLENLSDYKTVSPFDDMPAENLFAMTTINPFD